MKFSDLQRYFSSARINRYLAAVSNSKTRAAKLYKANLLVSQAFHPLLGVVEVVLRNRLNDVLTSHFMDQDWIVNQKAGFMSDISLTYLDKRTGRQVVNDFLKSEITRAENRLKRIGVPLTSGKIIAEQTFGFWTELFEVYHYRLLKGVPIKIFQSLPSGYGRKEIHAELESIRRFRNRINHNEPVCFKANTIDLSEARAAYSAIQDILRRVDPVLLRYTHSLDKVQKAIDRAAKV
jgi:hypothetical protein